MSDWIDVIINIVTHLNWITVGCIIILIPIIALTIRCCSGLVVAFIKMIFYILGFSLSVYLIWMFVNVVYQNM